MTEDRKHIDNLTVMHHHICFFPGCTAHKCRGGQSLYLMYNFKTCSRSPSCERENKMHCKQSLIMIVSQKQYHHVHTNPNKWLVIFHSCQLHNLPMVDVAHVIILWYRRQVQSHNSVPEISTHWAIWQPNINNWQIKCPFDLQLSKCSSLQQLLE